MKRERVGSRSLFGSIQSTRNSPSHPFDARGVAQNDHALRFQFRRLRAGLIRRLDVLDRSIQMRMLERHRNDAAFPVGVLHVSVVIVEARHSKASQHSTLR